MTSQKILARVEVEITCTDSFAKAVCLAASTIAERASDFFFHAGLPTVMGEASKNKKVNHTAASCPLALESGPLAYSSAFILATRLTSLSPNQSSSQTGITLHDFVVMYG
ncbi:MAG: hypothetical protein IKG83_07535, partial [Prevotella sp.]|nr:hypothetical protein [Prevotella sp.]